MSYRYDEYEIDGRTKILADGNEASIAAISDTFGRKGAHEVEWSWDSPFVLSEDADAPAGVPVTWTCTVTWWREPGVTTVGKYGPTADHHRGLIESAADVLRQRGSTVTILLDDEPADRGDARGQ